MMRKGDPVFKQLVDDVIANMQRSGEAAKLYETWFMRPFRPTASTCDSRCRREMKALFANPNDRAH